MHSGVINHVKFWALEAVTVSKKREEEEKTKWKIEAERR